MATLPSPRAPLTARPFFENKARAFWILQAAGWSGYLVLRGASAIANGFTLEGIIPVFIDAILGYCITLLLSTLYAWYRQLRFVVAVPLVLGTLAVAIGLYAALNGFSWSFIRNQQPGLTLGLWRGSPR